MSYTMCIMSKNIAYRGVLYHIFCFAGGLNGKGYNKYDLNYQKKRGYLTTFMSDYVSHVQCTSKFTCISAGCYWKLLRKARRPLHRFPCLYHFDHLPPLQRGTGFYFLHLKLLTCMLHDVLRRSHPVSCRTLNLG